MDVAVINQAARRSKLDYMMRTSINSEVYSAFKKMCDAEKLSPAEVVRQLVAQYMAAAETERALYEAANHINLSGPFHSGKELIEDALRS